MTEVKTPKPCPFCGPQKDEQYAPCLREDRSVQHDYAIGYSILCPGCGIELHDEYLEDVLTKWDTRPGEDATHE